MQPPSWRSSEQAGQGSLRACPREDHSTIRPTRYAAEKKEFQQLIAELKRLSLKHGYSLAQIASEVGVSQVTVNNWWTGHSLMAQRENIERLKEFLTAHA
jgi:DNA-binding XRE family transcriptional regulator